MKKTSEDIFSLLSLKARPSFPQCALTPGVLATRKVKGRKI